MEWIPDAYQMKGYDNSRSCAEIVKALQEFGGVTLHINCGAEGVLERAKSSLAEKGVDTADIPSCNSPIRTSMCGTTARRLWWTIEAAES